MAKKKVKQTATDKAWKEGFERGMQAAMSENLEYIEVGKAILTILDDRIRRQMRDY